MTFLEKLQAIATALSDIVTGSAAAQTALTDLNTFLDTLDTP